MNVPGTELFTVALLGIQWARPLGLLALALPVALALLLRRRDRPRPEATGTLALWEEVGEGWPARSRRTRRGLPPRAKVLCAALTLGALAVAGPRPEEPPRAGGWRVVVDRSPSMYLDAEAGGTRTRLEAALDAGLELLVAEAGPEREHEWITPGEPTSRGPRPPAAWSDPPGAPREEPRWERWDEPGHLWITDRAPRSPEGGASVSAAGGAARPGLVGHAGARELLWDGVRLVEGGAARRGTVASDGALPAELAELFAIWVEERGLEVSGRPPGAAGHRLVLRGVAEGRGDAVRAGRDGWALDGTAARGGTPMEDEEGALEPWLGTPDGGLRLVSWAPGRVWTALSRIERLSGDPAAFAVSWSGLFDRAARPPEGSVPVAERLSAGGPTRVAGDPPAARARGGRPEAVPLEAWLALGALTLAALAWFSQRPSRPGRAG